MSDPLLHCQHTLTMNAPPHTFRPTMPTLEPKKVSRRGRFSPTGAETVQIRVAAKLAEKLRKRAKSQGTTVAVVVAQKDF